MSILDSSGALPAIFVHPDKEWTVRPTGRRLMFEVPRELHELVMNAPGEETRYAAFGRVYKEFAMPAIKDAIANPKKAGFEVLDREAFGLKPSEMQESAEHLITRTLEKKALAQTKPVERDVVNWEIWVWAKERKLVVPRFRERLGPEHGFEANKNLPKWAQRNVTVHDETKGI